MLLKSLIYLQFFLLLCSGSALYADEISDFNELKQSRSHYRAELDDFRRTFGGSYALPTENFFFFGTKNFYLFGTGNREKLIYKNGSLYSALTNKLRYKWDVEEEIIAPHAYTVAIKTKDKKYFFLVEDAVGFSIKQKSNIKYLSKNPISLPTFDHYKYQSILKVLHQELLINVVDGKPLPNYFVYKKPWYRDSAMMAMVFKKTGNLALIKHWILNLRDPYDSNNGIKEPDNLGQALYLISLVSDQSHPLVPVIQKELQNIEKSNGVNSKKWIEGYSDFSLHPVYQTKWAKFGLTALGLPDNYSVPQNEDSYATLFWWAYKDLDIKNQPTSRADDYPYLQWASNHYIRKKQGLISNQDYPLTWEAKASAAQYRGIANLNAKYFKSKVAAPHSWHAAEVFLTLLEEH